MASDEIMDLVDFAREKRMEQKRAQCPVCQLPEEVREQITSASDRGIKQKEVLAWLEEVHGIELAHGDLNSHSAGRHDE